jgi:predicted SnoaL-like aldol condensation-catalyzing enzyme/AcrR family transcriptional regulator
MSLRERVDDSRSDIDAGILAKKGRRVRRSRAERRDEIARATYKLLGEQGLGTTTVAQIAKAVGMSVPALYGHYESRQDMLVAAMEPVFERVSKWLSLSKKRNIRERLRETGKVHSTFMTSELGFVIPVFEFVLAPRDTDLAFRFGKRQLEVIERIAATVAEGQHQGTVRTDLDPMRAAWEIIILAWSEDIAHLMGLQDYIAKGYSREILDLFIRDMAPPEEKTQASRRREEERERMIESNRAEHGGVEKRRIEANKQTVLDFYDLLINQKDFAAASAHIGSYYRQHNPLVADGPEGLAAFVDFLRNEHPEAHSEIKRVLADPDHVILHVHSTRAPHSRGRAIIEIFRLEEGKIVEHWDTIQEIPEASANPNGMF